MQTDLEKPEVVAATSTVTELVTLTSNYAIKTVDEYTDGSDLLRRVKAAQGKLEETRTAITGPMNAALKAVNAFFKGPTDKLTAAESCIKRAMITFSNEQDRLRLAEQAKANEIARKERERLEAQARKAQDSGKVVKAEALEQRAATVVAPIIQRAAPKIAGVQTREVWKYEVTDPAAVPNEYKLVDESKIRRVVGALKGDTQIAGVRVWSEKSIAAASA